MINEVNNDHSTVPKYKVNYLTDTGTRVTLDLAEDVDLEVVSKQQMMLEAISTLTIDAELKEQVKPFLETILKAQPQTKHLS